MFQSVQVPVPPTACEAFWWLVKVSVAAVSPLAVGYRDEDLVGVGRGPESLAERSAVCPCCGVSSESYAWKL